MANRILMNIFTLSRQWKLKTVQPVENRIKFKYRKARYDIPFDPEAIFLKQRRWPLQDRQAVIWIEGRERFEHLGNPGLFPEDLTASDISSFVRKEIIRAFAAIKPISMNFFIILLALGIGQLIISLLLIRRIGF